MRLYRGSVGSSMRDALIAASKARLGDRSISR